MQANAELKCVGRLGQSWTVWRIRAKPKMQSHQTLFEHHSEAGREVPPPKTQTKPWMKFKPAAEGYNNWSKPIKVTDVCMSFSSAGVQRRLQSPRPGSMLFWEGYSGTFWERSTGPTSSPKRSKWSSVRSGWEVTPVCTNKPSSINQWIRKTVFK